jgi:hypothetical protein
VENAGGHGRNPNDILDLLCREHFPKLVEYDGVTGPPYTFDYYVVAPDTVDRDDREFNNKAERVKQELWVSAFRPRGVPGPTSKIVAACPSPDGLARDGTQGGKTRLVLSCARGMRLQ